MNWRLIEQETYSAAMNMAIDHAIYESVANGRESPTIRFYKWLPSSVSIGAYQNSKEINLEACKKHNIGIVRRMTGGRAVFHDKMDFTYSVIAPIRVFNYSIENAYRQICSWIINSLGELGIKASLENKNDIMVDGKKISGNAAKAMDKGVYLQHGTLIYDIDMEMMPTALNISKEVVNEKVTSILQHKKASQEDIYSAFKNNFLKDKEIKIEELSKYEAIRADDLAVTRYNHLTLPSGTLLKNKGACYVERGAN
ncbi:lipoate--protein ligase family protein [Candidatus Woesearchaeota archaeon]|nr:lipoate--protein ligase family protein [Candidatus Woesearchaeota archaeon]